MSVENKYRERLTEGMLSTGLMALAALFTKSKTRKNLKHVAWVMKNDPQAQAAMADFDAAKKRADDAISSYCKRNPDSPLCKD
jgi:hypothetical protein